MKINKKRAVCLVCGTKIPYIRHISISHFISAECPQCHTYMTFNKKTHLIQLGILVLLFPSLSLIYKHGFLIAFLVSFALLILSFSINYYAKYKIDPAHEARVNNNGENT